MVHNLLRRPYFLGGGMGGYPLNSHETGQISKRQSRRKKCAQMVWFSLVNFFSDHIGTVKEISCFLDTLLGTRKHIPNQPTLLSR